PLVVDCPARLAQQFGDLAVAIAAVLPVERTRCELAHKADLNPVALVEIVAGIGNQQAAVSQLAGKGRGIDVFGSAMVITCGDATEVSPTISRPPSAIVRENGALLRCAAYEERLYSDCLPPSGSARTLHDRRNTIPVQQSFRAEGL